MGAGVDRRLAPHIFMSKSKLDKVQELLKSIAKMDDDEYSEMSVGLSSYEYFIQDGNGNYIRDGIDLEDVVEELENILDSLKSPTPLIVYATSSGPMVEVSGKCVKIGAVKMTLAHFNKVAEAVEKMS